MGITYLEMDTQWIVCITTRLIVLVLKLLETISRILHPCVMWCVKIIFCRNVAMNQKKKVTIVML